MRRRALTLSLVVSMALSFMVSGNVAAAQAVGLGTAGDYAVLGGSAVTNTGPTVMNGNLGVSPGTSVTGFPPGIVHGTIHAADAAAAQAQADLTTAYNNVAGQACDTNLTGQDLGGLTLTTGVYCFDSSAQLTGTLTLDAQGVPDALFLFQIGSSLTTASSSSVSLINGAQSCNVFWKVGSSATLGTATSFVGNILALTSITLTTSATLRGRALAQNGAVTLDSNVITRATCQASGSECTGTFTGGTYSAIVVPDGATCTLVGVGVTGDVTVGKHSTLITSGQTQIGGDVTAVGARSVRLINTDVVGDVNLSATRGRIVIGSETCRVDPTVGGSIRLIGNFGTVAVCQMTIGGSLIANRTHTAVGLFGNVVAGNLIVQYNRHAYGVWVNGNTVGGYILVRRNSLSSHLIVRNNDVVGDLRCFHNSPAPRHRGNTVGGLRLGQCSGPE
jgi:hypothetical protein